MWYPCRAECATVYKNIGKVKKDRKSQDVTVYV